MSNKEHAILLEALKEIRRAINSGRLKWDLGDGQRERRTVGGHDTLCYCGWVAYDALKKIEGIVE